MSRVNLFGTTVPRRMRLSALFLSCPPSILPGVHRILVIYCAQFLFHLPSWDTTDLPIVTSFTSSVKVSRQTLYSSSTNMRLFAYETNQFGCTEPNFHNHPRYVWLSRCFAFPRRKLHQVHSPSALASDTVVRRFYNLKVP